jgi:3-phytase
VAYANDAFGFGFFPGQFGMVVYSKHPIAYDLVRTFRKFLWKDMPGNLIPPSFYSPDEVAILRLSSKSHWDIPIRIGKKTVHFLVSHPTPPVFDGPEDRNGRRNHDEIRFWADYITPGRSDYIYDDEGQRGGLKPGELFVIAGDQNSDPLDGDSVPGAIQQLLEHPLVNGKLTPASAGAAEASMLQGGANATHRSDPRFDTADFGDFAPGNLRADYVLPRNNLQLVDAGVFWPLQADPLFRLTGVFDSATWGPVGGFPTSDHRSVWIDVTVPSVK